MSDPVIPDTWPGCGRSEEERLPIVAMEYMDSRIYRVRELLRHLAAVHAEPLNAARIGRKMGVSSHTILQWLAVLRRIGVVRLLPSTANHRPYLYLRDCRLIADIGVESTALLRGCLVERVIAMYRALAPDARFYQWQEARVKRLDLVVSLPTGRVGFRFTGRLLPRYQEEASLLLARRRGVIDWGFVFHRGFRATIRAPVVISLPAGKFLGQLDRWLACGGFRQALQLLRDRGGEEAYREGMSRLGSTSAS